MLTQNTSMNVKGIRLPEMKKKKLFITAMPMVK